MNWKTVITGDLVKSGKIKGEEWERLLELMKTSFREIGEKTGQPAISFEVFRGDSFQGSTIHNEEAARIAVLIRAAIRSFEPKETKRKTLIQAYSDARISVGMGLVESPMQSNAESKGSAYEYSGRALDKMKIGDQRLSVTTPVQELNEELKALCMLADAIISQWSPNQAAAIYRYFLMGESQQQVADHFGVSQPAIRQRLVVYGKVQAIESFLARYKQIIWKYSG